MKVFVVCFALVALTAAWQPRDGNDWRRYRFMKDLHLDDHFYDRSYDTTKYNEQIYGKDFEDSHEKLYGIGVHSGEQYGKSTTGDWHNRNRYDSAEVTANWHNKDSSLERDHIYSNTFGGKVKTIDNVDKKYVKYDDDIKRLILRDDKLLIKQKFILDVLRNVFTLWTDADKTQDASHIVDGEQYYKDPSKVVDFFRMIRNKGSLLPRGRIFTIKSEIHSKQLAALFNLFFYSKDFNVFMRNVLWARKYVNEEMFVHALIAAVKHRDDLVGVKLPAIYEILPHKFHTSIAIEEAQRFKDIVLKNKKDFIVLNKYTNDYVTMNDESKLTYLTEDIGWNAYNYFFHVDFASWIGGKDFKLFNERRGEKYLYHLQQILARYNLERYTHGLGDIKDIGLWSLIETGYNPLMKHFNGIPVPLRRNYFDVRTAGDFFLLDRVVDYGRRIRDAIDKGYATSVDGGKVDLKHWDAVDVLGNMIHGNKDCVNPRYYGGYVGNFVKLISGNYIKNTDSDKLITGVMAHHESILRDPVSYQLLKKILKFYYQFKDTLPSYQKEDLILDGVRVIDIKTTPLVTYFDHFDVDITNIVRTTKYDDTVTKDNTLVRARHMRLNHKPFTVKIDLTVEKPQKVVVRLFLGPKFDKDGKIFNIRKHRENFVEIDKFTRDLTTGHATIDRFSRDFVYTVKDRTTFVDIYRQVLLNNDVNKLIDMHVDESDCGFPDRLVLPKGWVGGMPMQLFVIVTKAKDVVKRDITRTMICGQKTYINEVDEEALGFPFDRRIDVSEFYTKNMLFKDVLVHHENINMKETVDFDGKSVDSREFDELNHLK